MCGAIAPCQTAAVVRNDPSIQGAQAETQPTEAAALLSMPALAVPMVGAATSKYRRKS